jgi:2-C-methyl-D-erythritol 4-phosphate cytidylyltransferase
MQTIQLAFDSAIQFGSGIPAIPLHDSIRQVDGENNFAVNRSLYKIIQTPQCFTSSILLEAFKQNYNSEFTDDASVIEAHGAKVTITPGNVENIKITTPKDLVFAETLIDFVI